MPMRRDANWAYSPNETRNGQIAALGPPVEPMVVDTLGGRMHVRWDESSHATPNGQLVFFAEFLRAAGVFDEWVRACPLEYRSGNAPGKRDVLDTLLLAILAGHRRYAHVTSLRGEVSPHRRWAWNALSVKMRCDARSHALMRRRVRHGCARR